MINKFNVDNAIECSLYNNNSHKAKLIFVL